MVMMHSYKAAPKSCQMAGAPRPVQDLKGLSLAEVSRVGLVLQSLSHLVRRGLSCGGESPRFSSVQSLHVAGVTPHTSRRRETLQGGHCIEIKQPSG